MRRNRWLIGLFLAPVALIVSGCTSPGGTTPPSRQLSIGATAVPDSMDPTTNANAAIPQALLYNVYETLVKLDGDGNIRPLLAKEWTISNDGLTYTFDLQPGATFASGDQLNADAVVKSIQRIQQDPTVTAVNKAEMSVVSSVTAVDDNTVKVVLSAPSNAWLYNMTGSAGIIIDPAHASDLSNTPAGSGPYQLKDWVKGASVELQKSDKYWGTPARFDIVTFRYFSDPNAMNTAMLSGDLDIISNLAAPQALSQFSDTSKYQTIVGTTNGEIVLGFNDSKAPFTDARVRQAICYAIDRKALMDSVWAGQGMLIGSMVPPTDPWYEDLSQTYPFDPDKAKQLLADAGATNLTINLQVPTLPYATSAAQFIASQLKDVGINVNVSQLQFPDVWINQVMGQGDYDMTIVAHVEPRDIVKWADPTYYWHYNNPDFQNLISQADQTLDQTQYVDLMKQAAKILSTDAAGDFLWLLPSIIIATPDISGIPANAVTESFDLTTIASKSG